MVNDEGQNKPAWLPDLFEIGVVLFWALWVGRAFLDLDPRVWPYGREFGMAIQPHFIWTQLLRCGDCVLWNGYWNGGSPTLANLHAAIAHPLVVASTVVFGGVNGAKVALAGSLALAGVAQWWLARVMGLGRVPRLWTACLVVAAGHLAGRMEHGAVALVISTAACSLVLAPALQVARHGGRRNSVLLAVTLALAIVAGQGYMQIALFLGILPLYALFLFDDQGRLRPTWKAFGGGLGLGLLLAGVFLVPLAHFWPQFGKDIDPAFRDLQPLAYIPLNFVIPDPGFYRDTLLGKKPWGYLYMNYVGWIPVLLALVAVRLMPREKGRLLAFLVLGIVVPLLMAAGIPFRWLARLMPALVGGMRSLPVVAGLATPFLLALAGWGLDELMRRDWPTLSFESGTGGRRVRLNTMPILLALIWFASLLAVYQFSRAWLRTVPASDLAYRVVDTVRTSDAQWVALPHGEHYWAPVAAERGVKLTNVVRPSHWRNRKSPPPYVYASRSEPASGTPVAKIGDLHVVHLPDNAYAAVQTPLEVVPCTAKARGGQIDVACENEQPGTLVVRENTWAGWRAWRDGSPVRLRREGRYLSTKAPAGRHAYSFRYQPWDARLGALLSILGVLLAITLWWPELPKAIRRRLSRADS